MHRLLAVVVLLFGLVGCGNSDQPPAGSPVSALPATSADRPFLDQVRSSTAIDKPDAELIIFADRACGYLDTTRSVQRTISTLSAITSWSSSDTATFVGASVRHYCRELAPLQ